MLREGSVPKSSYPCRWPLLIIVAVDFLNFLCVTEVLARSLLAMPAAAERAFLESGATRNSEPHDVMLRRLFVATPHHKKDGCLSCYLGVFV